MTNGVYELMDAESQSEYPQMGGSMPPEPEVESGFIRFVTRAIYWRIWALLGGILAAIVAFYIFYFQPLFHLTSPWDSWLERNRCIFQNLCTAGNPEAIFVIPHHVGLLALLAALLLLGITLQKPVDLWFPEKRPIRRFNPNYIPFFITIGSLAVLYQVYLLFITRSTPGLWPWFLGLFFFGWAALLWDWRETDSVAYTTANLLLAVGTVLLIIGAAAVATGSMSAAILLAVGGALFLWGNLQASQLDSHFQLIDYIIMLVLALVALSLGLMRVWEWQYAFVGDEWGFFTVAQDLIHKSLELSYFSAHDSNGYHTVFSSVLQSTIMRLAGENVFGWRLSSLLPMVFSVPALYIFLRWATPGRNAATLGAGLLAVSHMLLSFSMVGYNNTQALLPLTLGLGAFAFAQYHFSALRYLLLGIVLGSSFLLFGLGRLALIPLALLIVFYVRSSLQRMTLARLFIILGFIGTAAPTLFNLDNWQALLKATPIESEAGAFTMTQILQNVVGGLQAFATSDHNTHFVVGPHLDPLTALLMIIGIGAILFTFLRNPRTLGWLGAALLFWVAVSGVQQYTHVANTRMFILIPIYASLAGIGGAMLIQQLIVPNYPRIQLLFVGLLLTIGMGLNQLHIEEVALPTMRWTPEAILVQQLQKSQALDRGGMPTYVVWDGFPNHVENEIIGAYDVSLERVRFINGEEALSLSTLCNNDLTTPKMVLLHVNHEQAAEIDDHMRACWPDVDITGIHNDADERTLQRYLNRPGAQQMGLAPEQRTSYRLYPDSLAAREPQDIVLDKLGDLYVLSTAGNLLSSTPAVIHFAPDGAVKNRLDLIQDEPQVLEITSDGLLLVGAKDGSAGLVWYDQLGQPLRISQVDLGGIADLAINTSGQIFASSRERSLIYQLSPQGEIEQEFTGQGRLERPSALAVDDSSIWVLNDGENRLLELSSTDEVLNELPLPNDIVAHGIDFTIDPDGSVLLSQVASKRVVRLDAQGKMLNIWDGFKRPTGLATDYSSRLYVMDPDVGGIHVLSLRADIQPVEQVASPLSPMATPAQAEIAEETVEAEEAMPTAEDESPEQTPEAQDVDRQNSDPFDSNTTAPDESLTDDNAPADEGSPEGDSFDPQDAEALEADTTLPDGDLVNDSIPTDEGLPEGDSFDPQDAEALEADTTLPDGDLVNDSIPTDEGSPEGDSFDPQDAEALELDATSPDQNTMDDSTLIDEVYPESEGFDPQDPEFFDPGGPDALSTDEIIDEADPGAIDQGALNSVEEGVEMPTEVDEQDADSQPESPLLTDDVSDELSQPASPLESGE